MESPSLQKGAAASKHPSCALCNQRKVKCDKQDPCSNCTRARTQCIYKPHAIPRRGKARPKESDLLARLRRCEALLEKNGIEVQKALPEGGEGAPRLETQDQDQEMEVGEKRMIFSHEGHHKSHIAHKHNGKLITKGGQSMYLENHLWTSLSEKMRNPEEMLQAQSDEDDEAASIAENFDPNINAYDLLLGPSPITNVKDFYPTVKEASFLWQAFLENVNPLTKCIHIPTFQPQFFEAMQNPIAASKQIEALVLAILAISLNSLSDEDCRVQLGDGKKRLLRRYHVATQRALANANFLKSSDITVLQAFFYFLLSIRTELDPRVLWLLTGMCARIGQRIGIHRDGASLGLSPFQTEMRRRLSWQVCILDAHTGQLSGSGGSMGSGLPDMIDPLNVNDEDLHPDMKSPPEERKGATEMMFNMIRFNYGRFFRPFIGKCAYTGASFDKWRAIGSFGDEASRMQTINDLEELLESRYLRYCDPLLPLHALTMLVGRSGIAGMRLMAQHPMHRTDRGAGMTQAEKDQLFTLSLRILGYHNQAMSQPQLQRYLWHIGQSFQFGAMVYLVGELRHRVSGPEVDEAWRSIADLFKYRPELPDRKRALHVALTSLTLKAWKAREAELVRFNGSTELPPFIAAIMLQKVAHRKHEEGQEDQPQIPPNNQTGVQLPTPSSTGGLEADPCNRMNDMYNFEDLDGFSSSNLEAIDTTSPMNWAAWDNLMKDFDSSDGRALGL